MSKSNLSLLAGVLASTVFIVNCQKAPDKRQTTSQGRSGTQEKNLGQPATKMCDAEILKTVGSLLDNKNKASILINKKETATEADKKQLENLLKVIVFEQCDQAIDMISKNYAEKACIVTQANDGQTSAINQKAIMALGMSAAGSASGTATRSVSGTATGSAAVNDKANEYQAEDIRKFCGLAGTHLKNLGVDNKYAAAAIEANAKGKTNDEEQKRVNDFTKTTVIFQGDMIEAMKKQNTGWVKYFVDGKLLDGNEDALKEIVVGRKKVACSVLDTKYEVSSEKVSSKLLNTAKKEINTVAISSKIVDASQGINFNFKSDAGDGLISISCINMPQANIGSLLSAIGQQSMAVAKATSSVLAAGAQVADGEQFAKADELNNSEMQAEIQSSKAKLTGNDRTKGSSNVETLYLNSTKEEADKADAAAKSFDEYVKDSSAADQASVDKAAADKAAAEQAAACKADSAKCSK